VEHVPVFLFFSLLRSWFMFVAGCHNGATQRVMMWLSTGAVLFFFSDIGILFWWSGGSIKTWDRYPLERVSEQVNLG